MSKKNLLSSSVLAGLKTHPVYARKWRPALFSNTTWGTAAKLSVARYDLGGVYSNGRVYAIRGDSGNNATLQDTPVECYDTSGWLPKTTDFARAPGRGVVAASNGKIYAIGGMINSNTIPTSQSWDPNTSGSINIAGGGKGFMQVSCAWPGVAAINEKIYAIGGYHQADDGYRILNEIQCLDTVVLSWETVGYLTVPRHSLAAVVGSNGQIYAIGGINGDGDPQNSVEVFDPEAKTCTPVSSMRFSRYDFAAVAASDGKLYAIGGLICCDGNTAVEQYDISQDQWTFTTPLSQPRFSHAAAITPDGTIYAFGGAKKNMDTIELLDSVEVITAKQLADNSIWPP